MILLDLIHNDINRKRYSKKLIKKVNVITETQAQTERLFPVDDELKQELIQTFMIEFEELLELYENSLNVLRSPNGKYEDAYKDLFRIYHTLKGDAGYFPEFSEFTKFATHYCEKLRPLDENVFKNRQLRKQLVQNYDRLSMALSQFSRGSALQTFRFKLFLRNF